MWFFVEISQDFNKTRNQNNRLEVRYTCGFENKHSGCYEIYTILDCPSLHYCMDYCVNTDL